MLYAGIILFASLYSYLCVKKLPLAIGILFLLLPTYLIRFSLGPIPSTVLEVIVILLIVTLLATRGRSIIRYHVAGIKKLPLLYVGIALFVLAATVAIIPSVDLRAAAGEWKAFYIEPILLFLVLLPVLEQENNKATKPCSHVAIWQSDNVTIKQSILLPLIASGVITAIFAIYQKFTGFFVPYDFWENMDTYRVTAWYGFPNAVGLFLAPLVPLLFLLKDKARYPLLITGSLLLIVAIFFAKSTGALIGVAAGIGFVLLTHKKTRIPTIIVGCISAILLLTVPAAQPIKRELLLQDRSGQIRISMWAEAWKLIKDNPLSGAGLASYQEKVEPYHTRVNGEGIEIFHHPHNIFLTMWVNLGLAGLIGFLFILGWFVQQAIAQRYNPQALYVTAAMLTLLVAGLVDSPYIKNDLAILFWTLPLLMLTMKPKRPYAKA